MACRVEPPAPAIIGTLPAQVRTAVEMISLYSLGSREKHSPVPPADKSALAPYWASYSGQSAWPWLLKLAVSSSYVTGKGCSLSSIMVLSSSGVTLDMLGLADRGRRTT